jgi:hypothetical protein
MREHTSQRARFMHHRLAPTMRAPTVATQYPAGVWPSSRRLHNMRVSDTAGCVRAAGGAPRCVTPRSRPHLHAWRDAHAARDLASV